MKKPTLEGCKSVAAILQSIATVFAFAAGGWWALHNSSAQRHEYPKLQITQRITHFRVSDKFNLVVVDDAVSNVGPVLLRLRRGEIRLVKVVPLPQVAELELNRLLQIKGHYSEMDDPDTWKLLETRPLEWGENDFVLEPGEGDQIHSLFMVPSNVRLVTVATRLVNPKGGTDLGWRAMNTYELNESTLLSAGEKKRGIDGRR